MAEGEKIDSSKLVTLNYNELKKISIKIPKSPDKELRFFHKDTLDCYDLEEFNRAMIKGIDLKIKGEDKTILILPVHMPSKLNENKNPIDRAFNVLEQKIESISQTKNNTKHIIYIGDFNLNPDELGDMANILTTTCPRGHGVTKISGIKYRIYYNPSNHLLGNFNQETLGSYYHTRKWQLLDQVIMSKKLVKLFKKNEFKLLNLNNKTLLLANDKPNKKLISDHLPICLEYDFI